MLKLLKLHLKSNSDWRLWKRQTTKENLNIEVFNYFASIGISKNLKLLIILISKHKTKKLSKIKESHTLSLRIGNYDFA